MQSFSRQRIIVRPLVATFVIALATPMAFPLAASADDFGVPLVNGGAARLSYADGRVTIGRGSAGATAAGIGAPVAESDYISTGAQSSAEVRFDGTSVVRLGENVQMRLAHLDADGRDLQLAAGTIDVRLVRGLDGRTSIDTPSVSVVPDDVGSYRVTVDDHGTTFVTVRSGHAAIETPHGSRALAPGSTLVAEGTASNPRISSRDEIAADDFDAFNQDRDRRQLAASSAPSYGTSAPPVDDPSVADAVPSYAQSGLAPSYAPAYVPAPVVIPSYAQPTYVAPYYAPPYYAQPYYAPRATFVIAPAYPAAYLRPVYRRPVYGWMGGGYPVRVAARPLRYR